MADVFDQIAPEKADIFDQIASEKGVRSFGQKVKDFFRSTLVPSPAPSAVTPISDATDPREIMLREIGLTSVQVSPGVAAYEYGRYLIPSGIGARAPARAIKKPPRVIEPTAVEEPPPFRVTRRGTMASTGEPAPKPTPTPEPLPETYHEPAKDIFDQIAPKTPKAAEIPRPEIPLSPGEEIPSVEPFPAPPAEPLAPKQPWEMTKQEFQSSGEQLFHGSPKPFIGEPRTGRASLGLTGPLGESTSAKDIFEGFYTANDPSGALLYAQGNKGNIVPVWLSKNAKVLDLSGDIISQEVLGTPGSLARSRLSSLKSPSKPFPFQEQFERFAEKQLNESRLKNGKKPIVLNSEEWNQKVGKEFDPTSQDWNAQGLAGQYLEKFVKQQGYDAIKMGRETVIFNPKKAIVGTHESLVKQALREGKPVPPKVLAEYQDLFRATEEAKQPDLFNPNKPQSIAEAAKEGEKTLDEQGRASLELLTPGLEAGSNMKQGVLSLLLPTAKSADHLRAAEITGSQLGSMWRDTEIASHALKTFSRLFDKLGVHNPNTPLPENLGALFMSDVSVGRDLDPKVYGRNTSSIRGAAHQVDLFFKDRLKKLEAAGAKLESVRENYFPGMWKDKTAAEQFLSKRPFKGAESFRRQKVFDDIMEGIQAGLEPISNNPMDLVKLKLAEMDRSIMANRALQEWKARGDVAEIPFNQRIPEGWQKINDKYGIVWGAPQVPVWRILRELAKTAKKDLYFARFGKEVFPSVLEVAEGADDAMKIEANALRWDTPKGPINIHAMHIGTGRSYSQLLIEKLLENQDAFMEEAPTIYKKLQDLADNSEKLRAILGTPIFNDLNQKLPVGGPVMRGYRIARTPVAEVLNNYLSSSLYNNRYFGAAYKGVMGVANSLNQSQLGMGSFFHAGSTAILAQVSAGANVIKDVYGVLRGNRSVGDLAKTVGKFPLAWIQTGWEGNRIVREFRNPTALDVPTDVAVGGLPQTPEMRLGMIAKAMELSGLSTRLEYGLRTHQIEAMARDWYGKQYARAAVRSPVAIMEMMAKPIMDGIVPRQKAGVFSEMVGRLIEMNPGKTLKEMRPQLRQIGNRVEARLGQVHYNRLFINNTAKNMIQVLVRAPGWSGGTIAEIGGAFKDTASFLAETIKTGKLPENISDRVAFTLSLMVTVAATNAALTYAFTGEKPSGLDYWAFRTGGTDERGNPERFVLPSYMKDIWAYYDRPGHTLTAKMNPILSLAADLVRNQDYYGTQIRNKEDPYLRQGGQVLSYALKQYVPFWVRGAMIEKERGGGLGKTIQEYPLKILGPEIGVMPAPSRMQQSRAERYLSDVLSDYPRPSLSREDAAKRKLVVQYSNEVAQAIQKGEDPWVPNLLADYHSGKITDKDIAAIERRLASGTSIERMIRSPNVSFQAALHVYELATPEEKAKIRDIILDKGDKLTEEQIDELWPRISRAFGLTRQTQ